MSSEAIMPEAAPLPPLVPVVVKWYDGGQRELLPLGIVQVARITRLNAIARHLLPLLPSRLRARDNVQVGISFTSTACSSYVPLMCSDRRCRPRRCLYTMKDPGRALLLCLSYRR